MDSIVIVRKLLLGRPQLIVLLPGDAQKQVRAGVLPEGVALPAIGITEVTASDRHTLAGVPGSVVKVTAIAQITVVAKTTRELKAILAEARYACRNYVGSLAGVSGPVTAHLALRGPDWDHEAGFCGQSQDVEVTFDDVGLGDI